MGFPKFGHHSTSSNHSQSLSNLNNHQFYDNHSIELFIDIESPPCVLYGSTTESTGALLSGLLKLQVKNPRDVRNQSAPLSPVSSDSEKKKLVSSLGTTLSQTLSHLSLSDHTHTFPTSSSNTNLSSSPYAKVTVTSVTLSLIQKVRFHKPFQPAHQTVMSCMNCKSKVTELARWEVVKKTTEIPVGDHAYPFSHLVPGSIPASASLGSNSQTQIKYELIAVATYKCPKKTNGTSNGEKLIQLSLPIPITRSILRGPDRNSLRVFPPTDVTATAVLPNVIYPKSSFPLELKLDGVASEDRRWRMRRLTWRIEEKVHVRSNACKMHTNKLKQLEKQIKEKEDHTVKKGTKPIKRTQNSGPSVTVSVATLENTPLDPVPSSVPSNISGSRSQGDMDDDGVEHGDDLIHPSDDAMRQELLEQQERLRQEQLKQELEQGTALYTEEIRAIASGDIKNGWKSDFTGTGKIEIITDINCMGLNSGVSNPINSASTIKPYKPSNEQSVNVCCDIEDPTLGVYMSHLLIVEIIVAEEALQYASGQPIVKKSTSSSSPQLSATTSNNNADQRLAELSPMFASRSNVQQNRTSASNSNPLTPSTSHGSIKTTNSSRIVGVPTGAARVLRMQFRLTVTERSGLGISWDDEVPPTYQDVRLLSPPSYFVATSSSDSPLVQTPVASDIIQGGTQQHQNFDGSRSNSSSDLQIPTPPPVAHFHQNSFHGLASVQSPQLENVVSIQGNAPGHGHILTPHTTRDIGISNISELLDTDRITQ